ncbi:MAG: hypothetical protein ACXABY_09305 [Candidatus Thorarchaeota archaeon]|jgi:hypothetical protein
MAIMYDWVCAHGHVFEELAPSETTDIQCPFCWGKDEQHLNWDMYSGQSREIAMRKAADIKDWGVAHRVLLATPAWNKKSKTTLGIVVHRDAHGNFRHPGDPNAPVPPGFEKVEIDTIQHARKIEKAISEQSERIEINKLAGEHEHLEARRKAAEDDTRANMSRMSPRGQEFAKLAMQKAQEKAAKRVGRPKSGEGVGFDALSYDKSNRGDFRDESTGWKKKQE